MKIISELSQFEDIHDQIERLEDALIQGETCQVILSDTLQNEKDHWKETKALSYHGPARINPNSDNKVKVYICTMETLRDLKKLAKKKK